MLFNSVEFVFLFLPIVVTGFVVLGRWRSTRVLQGWLVASSLFFYGWWNPRYLVLIVASVLFNYIVGVFVRADARGRRLLIIGIVGNLLTLGFFKYTDFVLSNVEAATGLDLPLQEILLPLGISFFTFQQIAYLVDRYRGRVVEHRFLQYALFVVFFPQLIAGPIVHHAQMMPQLAQSMLRGIRERDLAIGLTIFAIGLFKKVVIADGMAEFVTPVFLAADQGALPSLFEAWGGALAYTFQIYFDFSGYSDMAIGLAAMFGLRLPLNFNSPYKARNIIEFWRSWHMTLSAFLKDYLYIPLGGGRRGRVLRYRNVMVTMLLGGLWHGAAWNFVLWGGLHGMFLVLNQLWRFVIGKAFLNVGPSFLGSGASRLLTFLSVVLAWVFFRAETVGGAWNMLRGMAGFNGVVVTDNFLPFLVGGRVGLAAGEAIGALPSHEILLLVPLLLAIVWWLPNTAQLMEDGLEGWWRRVVWRPAAIRVGAVSVLLIASLYTMVYQQNRISEFLYFQF